MLNENISTQRAKFDMKTLLQVAKSIEEGAYVSTLSLGEFINSMIEDGAFVIGFDPHEAMSKFNWHGDIETLE